MQRLQQEIIYENYTIKPLIICNSNIISKIDLLFPSKKEKKSKKPNVCGPWSHRKVVTRGEKFHNFFFFLGEPTNFLFFFHCAVCVGIPKFIFSPVFFSSENYCIRKLTVTKTCFSMVII